MNAPLDFSQFEVLTFDCYGTLIDWETGILAAVKKALAAHGKSASDQDILEKYAALEAEIEAGPYLPYRLVLARVMEGLGKHFGAAFSSAENDSLADSMKDWLPFPDTVDLCDGWGRNTNWPSSPMWTATCSARVRDIWPWTSTTS
jgi:2-haloacid dehalogenase